MSYALDLTQIPTGPDGKPDPVMLNAVLSRMLDDMQERLKYSYQREQQVQREASSDHVEVERLRSREVKVLERWVRRRAISARRLETIALFSGAAMVAIPLFIVLCAYAWRWAVLAVAG